MDESSKSKLAESPISPLPLRDAECAQCLGINEHHQHRPKGTESHWDLVTGEVPPHCLLAFKMGQQTPHTTTSSSLSPAHGKLLFTGNW